ncbi:hypothetical protein, partial [Amycolatopsis sp. WAC 04197]|uniref:hypothetical protein n=1 Tax=Amycolatopsis sp. WAC 04197 TaxID=2203199 RepID=UPI0013153379
MIPAPAAPNFPACHPPTPNPPPAFHPNCFAHNAANPRILATNPSHTAINAARADKIAAPAINENTNDASNDTTVANAIAAIATIITFAFTTSADAVCAIRANPRADSSNPSTPAGISRPKNDPKYSPVSPANAASTPPPPAANATRNSPNATSNSPHARSNSDNDTSLPSGHDIPNVTKKNFCNS